ncbi:hypothetical protein BH10PSE17_BH10PSE17_08240 [soil metagenome]
MTNWLGNQTFIAYAITVLVLCANLLLLWVYSGFARGGTKQAINEEDALKYGAQLTDTDPAPVARVLRAHDNASANIYPFLFLGLVYVMAGGTPRLGTALFAIFTIARLLHSLAYLLRLQPWRTVFFLVGLVATVVLMVGVVLQLLNAPCSSC